jgi:hypothetical protein
VGRSVELQAESNTTSTHDPKDPRSSVGYAIREVYAGTFTKDGSFVDLAKHVPDGSQTVIHASSIDPRHSASDLDMAAGDQTGMDFSIAAASPTTCQP